MQSKSEVESSTLPSEPRARVIARGVGLAFTLSLVVACGSPDLAPLSDGDADPSDSSEPSTAEGEASAATPAPDFDVTPTGSARALRKGGVRSPAVARTRSVRGALDAVTRQELLRVGRIEHTFSDGRTIDFINSEAGNFGSGDIILGKTEKLAEYIERVESEGVETHTRALVTDDDDDTWPNGIIPYEFDDNLSPAEKNAINAAAAEWNRDNPYVKWVTSNGSGDRVTFTRVDTDDYCGRSPIGRSFAWGGQDVEIDADCFTSGVIQHEMGHSAGLIHEHTRCGRDAFVTVHNHAVTGESPRGIDYDEACGDRNYGDYDYASLMHYPDNDFLDIKSSPTGVFMGTQSVAGQRVRLSQDDVNAVTWFHTKRTFSTTYGYGFAWAHQTSGTFQASSTYAANYAQPTGVRANITRLSTGRYRVDFPKLGKEVGGNVQVTAYGSDSARCKVEKWQSSGETLQVIVRCNTPQGVLADRQFALSYQRLPSPWVGAQGGYLYSNRLNESGAYTPDPWYQSNSAGRRNRVTRTSTGRYSVEFPGINVNGGTVRLTAFGANSDYCTIGGWGSSTVSVSCFDTFGTLKDSAFSIAFTDSMFTGSYGYAWAHDPSAARYQPSSSYQKAQIVGQSAPVSAPIMINRNGTGDYVVEFPGVPVVSSTVSVASYGGTNTSCKVVGWGATAPVGLALADRRVNVTVRCFDASGNPADSRYAITYMTNEYIIP